MPITRLFNYIPGSLAEGDKVQDEFDSIIGFINGLELDKLDAVGGNVSALNVLTTLDVDGLATFNEDVTIANGKALLFTGSACNIDLEGAVKLSKTKVELLGTSAELRLSGNGSFMAFTGSASGIQLGANASITTTTNTLSEALGLRINSGNSRLTSLELFLRGTSGAKFDVSKANLTSATLVMMAVGLPTVNPGVSGQVWNNAGVLQVVP
jgi:hypothetical protein